MHRVDDAELAESRIHLELNLSSRVFEIAVAPSQSAMSEIRRAVWMPVLRWAPDFRRPAPGCRLEVESPEREEGNARR
jgi:hypothetical protein